MEFHIKIDNLIATVVENSSGIFSGENHQSYWSAIIKSNIGLNIAGDANFSNDSVNMVNERELIDMWGSLGTLKSNEELVRDR